MTSRGEWRSYLIVKAHIGGTPERLQAEAPLSAHHPGTGREPRLDCWKLPPGIWILPRILSQFCSQGHFRFYQAIQEVWVIECSYKLPFIDYQLWGSIELCPSLTLFLYILFESRSLNENTNTSWLSCRNDFLGDNKYRQCRYILLYFQHSTWFLEGV